MNQHSDFTFDFDTPKPPARASKWETMASITGATPPADAIPLWLAQMDFLPAPVLTQAAQRVVAAGEYGYFTGLDTMFERVAWWYRTRHGWSPDPAHMRATHGLGNAIGLTLQTLTEPGDEVIVFSPVYNEFFYKLRRNGRIAVESELREDEDGLFRMDLDTLEGQLTGRERAVLFCSPHNPGGRVWEAGELAALAAFCIRHDLLLISDEIHQDLLYPGHVHLPMAVAAPEILSRLVVLTAASKTFDIAGLRTGAVIIPDDALRARFTAMHGALDIQPNRMGVDLTAAAYTSEGAAWVDALMRYLDRNRADFCAAMDAIPGVRAMPMQSTYLAWVDFSRTGLTEAEIARRLHGDARVVPTPGAGLGLPGALHQRFNIGTQHARLTDAAARIRDAFSDLQ